MSTIVNPIFASTTIIKMYENATQVGTATGFFYKDEQDIIYLITNKHVIYGDDYPHNPDVTVTKLILSLHTDVNDLRKNDEYEISLFDGMGNQVWLEHTSPVVDVVLIPIDINREKYVIVPIDDSLLDTDKYHIMFEKIFVIGYPYGWYDVLNNLPVTRIGHLSSPFDVDFNGLPYMLGDVETHNGMSGGPVFSELNDYKEKTSKGIVRNMGSTRLILMGIHSGQFEWELTDSKTGAKEKINPSLIVIWNKRLIKEILK